MQKLSVMEFWFMDWLINDKKVDFVEYDRLSELQLSELHEEFINFYKSIQSE